MSNPQPSDPTTAYYDRNASSFAQDTATVNMSRLYAEFLPRVRPGGSILDAGCGAGRDSRYFISQGFAVMAFDASPQLARLCEQAIGQPVLVLRLQDLNYDATFDGIWACASLLHIPSSEMDAVLQRLLRALKAGAPMYVSFKYGNQEAVRNDRFFNDYDEPKFQALLARHPTLRSERIWQTQDARPGRQNELWLNAVLVRAC